jgi:hypothetical protein
VHKNNCIIKKAQKIIYLNVYSKGCKNSKFLPIKWQLFVSYTTMNYVFNIWQKNKNKKLKKEKRKEKKHH